MGSYAAIMLLVVLLALIGYGAFTYTEFERVRADLRATAETQAHAEVTTAIQALLDEAEAAAVHFARSDEVRLRLDLPRHYRSQRPLRPGADAGLPDHVTGAAVYDLDGVAIGPGISGALPDQIGTPPPPPYVHFTRGEPVLLVFHQVFDHSPPQGRRPHGHVGLQVDLLRPLRTRHDFRHVDPATIGFERGGAATQTPDALPRALYFRLRDEPMDDAVTGLLSGAILNLSIVFGVFALLLIPALVSLIVRPLRAISTHIDRLKAAPGGLILEEFGGFLPIAETENIRRSLNEYQTRLDQVRSSLEEKSRQLWDMAHHDALTGIKNRRAFDEFMQRLPRLLGDAGAGVTFALFDVNHFKAINDTYGHGVGDKILKVVARRICSVLRRGEELFRIGGDEFAVVLLECDDREALRIAERCHQKIVAYDFGKLGIREPLRISAGLAHAPVEDLADLQNLQWKADVAMYRAKRPGHANVVMYSDALARDCDGLFSSWVNTAVFDAVNFSKGLVMHYQPIVDLNTGAVCHYEALVRIEQDGELIMPSSIFQVVEARRLEVELDRAVLRQVLDDMRGGRLAPGTGVSINLSGPTLVHDRVCAWLDAFKPLLGDYRVMIEVTETALITQIGLANENLSRLRQRGFEIALDDFGSGYSSVRYLASMPVDVVKFDIGLVQGLRDDSQRVMVSHLAQMILESDHELVAEGIEDAVTLDAARAAGFGRGQGYLIGRPSQDAVKPLAAQANITPLPADRRA